MSDQVEPQGNVPVVPAKDAKPKPKPQRREGDPPGYNPGGETVKITAKMVKRNLVYGGIFIDTQVISNLATVGSSTSYSTHTKVDPGNPMNREEWTDCWRRLVAVPAFKQFAYSLRTDRSYIADHYGRAVSKRVIVPSGLLPLIRQYGTVRSDEGDWEVIGQPILVSTMLMRAVANPQELYAGVNQDVDRANSIGFDPSMPFAWEYLIEYVKGVINQWTYRNPLVVNNNGAISRITGACCNGGFEAFFAAFFTTPFPVHVLDALRIGAIAEVALAANPVPVGENVPAGVVGALNARGVVVFRWSRTELELRFAGYYAQVQMMMQPTLDELFVLTEISTMMDVGTPSQLVIRTDEENAFVTVKIPGDAIEIGSMMSTPRSGADHRFEPFRVETQFSPLDMAVKWFDGMKRGKKKNT